MQVESTHSILGWYYGNKIAVETRRVFNYENGNDVTVVERKFISVQMYNDQGVIPQIAKGQNIDQMI
jgi:hypothetical protein